MTPFQEAITIVHRLKVWIADERMGDGALLKSAADLIERLQAEKAEMESKYDAVSDALDYLRGLTPQQYEALHKDAARYRWLRVHSTGPSEGWSTHSNPESFDAAIDAAMEKKVDA